MEYCRKFLEKHFENFKVYLCHFFQHYICNNVINPKNEDQNATLINYIEALTRKLQQANERLASMEKQQTTDKEMQLKNIKYLQQYVNDLNKKLTRKDSEVNHLKELKQSNDKQLVDLNTRNEELVEALMKTESKLKEYETKAKNLHKLRENHGVFELGKLNDSMVVTKFVRIREVSLSQILSLYSNSEGHVRSLLKFINEECFLNLEKQYSDLEIKLIDRISEGGIASHPEGLNLDSTTRNQSRDMNVEEIVKKLLKDCYSVIVEMRQCNPPVRFFSAQEGDAFDAKKHKTVGNARVDGSNIMRTVSIGLESEKCVYEKAEVELFR